MKFVLRESFPYFKKYMGIFILCVFLGLTRVIIQLVEPQILALIVDRVINPALGEESKMNSSIFNFLITDIPKDDYWKILWVLIGTAVFFIVLYFITFYIRWNIAHFFSMKSENAMRKAAFNKINKSGQALQKSYTSGELITICNSDPPRVKEIYIGTIPFMIDNIFYIGMATYFLCRLNMKLLLFPVITSIIYFFLMKRYMRDNDKIQEELWVANTKLNTQTQESIHGIRTIKAYAKEGFQSEKFSEQSENLRKVYFRFANVRAKYDFIYTMVEELFYIISIVIGILLAVNLKMTSGEFTSFLAYLLMISNCFISNVWIVGDMQSSIVSGKRLFGFLNKRDEVSESYGSLPVGKKPEIVLNDVTVTADEQQLIKKVSLSIPYGKKIGIMGKTGSGKSVLLKAIQALTEISEGSIQIDGRDLKEYDMNEITRAFGYAMQNVFLFSNSISSNIAMYQPDASTEAILSCGKIAEVDEFASGFTNGYDTIIGEKGFGLSGGQKQRVAIARALIKDAPVLILDDCTSALDLETESKIFRNIKKHYGDKTILIATHRVSAIIDADEILFFEDGSIIERGTHEELLKQNGKYADIYRRQTGEEVFLHA